MRYRLVVRVTAADIGQRVTIRWRPPELDGSTMMTDVLGTTDAALAITGPARVQRP
jgi:hypothetical protein